MFKITEDPCDVQTRLDDEVRRLAHAEWLRTGNADEFMNWHEAEKQLGARLIHTGTVQWLYRELAVKDKQLAETETQARELEGRCSDLHGSATLAERLEERDARLCDMGTSLSNAEARLASREALLRGEIAAEQAKLASCEAKIRELEPKLDAQTATLAKRTRHLAECDSYVRSLKRTVESHEHDAEARVAAEERCQELESALEAKQAELTARNEQLKQQDSRISDMEAWLGSKREDLARSLAQLLDQGLALREREDQLQRVGSPASRIEELETALAAGRAELAVRDQELLEGAKQISGLEARLESRAFLPPAEAQQFCEGRVAQALEHTVRQLQSELAERDRRLSAERARVGKMEAIEEDLRRELNACATPQALELKPWEGHGPESGVRPPRLEASLMSSREELSMQREKMLARDKRLAQQEAQTQALSSLLRARRAELDARGSQLQALQSQVALRDQRIREQDQRSRRLERQKEEVHVQLQAHRAELETGRAELRERNLEISVQSAACLLQEERAAETCEARCERIAELEAKLRQRDGELVEQFATERALVAHSARLREVEESLAEACDRKVAQQEAQAQALGSLLKARTAELEAKGAQLEAQRVQLQAHTRRLEDQELHACRLQEARAVLAEELEAEAARRTEADERLRESDAWVEELGNSLQAHREELAASEAGIQARDEELAVFRVASEEQRAVFEERLQALKADQVEEELRAMQEKELQAQQEEILSLEEAQARLRAQHAEQREELCAIRSAQLVPISYGNLSKLEERLAQCLAKVHKAAEHASETRQSAVVKQRSSSKQGLARSFLTVKGVDFALLGAHPTVLEGFRRVLREAVSFEAGPGVSPEDVALELWRGSVVACCTITLPAGVSAASIEARLRSSATLAGAIMDALARLEGIDQVMTGPLGCIVHDVRPEARSSASTPSSRPADGGGDLATPQQPPPEEQVDSSGTPPPSRIARMLSVFTPGRGRRSTAPDQEDGRVRKIVSEIESKAPTAADTVTPRGEGATPSEGDSVGRRGSRQCFRSRAYQP